MVPSGATGTLNLVPSGAAGTLVPKSFKDSSNPLVNPVKKKKFSWFTWFAEFAWLRAVSLHIICNVTFWWCAVPLFHEMLTIKDCIHAGICTIQDNVFILDRFMNLHISTICYQYHLLLDVNAECHWTHQFNFRISVIQGQLMMVLKSKERMISISAITHRIIQCRPLHLSIYHLLIDKQIE